MPRSNITFYAWCVSNDALELVDHLVNKGDAHIYSFGSHTKVKWRCDKGHVFSTDFCKFTNPHRNRSGVVGVFACPVCNGQLVVAGVNDLGTTNPDLASE